MGGKKIIESLSENVEVKINEYIEENGQELIYRMIDREINRCTELKIGDIKLDIDFSKLIIKVYERIITNQLSDILSIINIEKIIEDKINAMDMKELERLILNVMKKELNAVIRLGAIIGFILGMLNIIS